MRRYQRAGLPAGEDEDRRRPLADDMQAHRVRRSRSPARARTSRSMPTAASISTPRWPTPRRCSPTGWSGSRSRCEPLDYQAHAVLCEMTSLPHCDRREPVLRAGLPQPGAARRHAPATATGCSPTLRSATASPRPCVSSTWPSRAGWSRRRCVPHGGHQLGLNMAAGLQLGGTESYPGVFQPYGGFRRRCSRRRRLRAPARGARHRHGVAGRHVRRDAQAPGVGYLPPPLRGGSG